MVEKTGIQSGTDAFDKSRFMMTFSTILGVTEILCCFKLVLEGKTGKNIHESAKKSAKNFALSDGEDNTSESLNKGGIADLPLSRTILAIRQKLQEQSYEK